MRYGCDVSNYTNAPDARWDALAQQIALCAPQAISPPAGYPPGVTRAQVQWSLDHKLLTVPYVWKWWSTGTDDIKRRLDLLTPFTGQIDHLALDVEDTTSGTLAVGHPMFAPVIPPKAGERLRRQPPPERRSQHAALLPLQSRVDELRDAFELCDQFPTRSGLKTMLYSASWFWGPYMGSTTVFSDRPGWGALYDGRADPGVWTPFAGLRSLAIKQYAGTSTLAGVGNLDLNVLADDYLAIRPTPRRPLTLKGPGVDLDPLVAGADPDPATLARLGLTWARLVERDTPQVRAYADALTAAGVIPVGVVTGETQGRILPNVRIKIFGNEMDTTDSNPARWPVGDARAYRGELDTYTGTYPDFDWIIGGLASGDPNVGYLRDVLAAGPLPACVVGVSMHPWAKSADEARSWIRQVKAAAGDLPIVLGEYNRPASELPGYVAMALEEVAAFGWYCHSDVQSLGSEGQRFGLFDEHGQPKDVLHALQAILGTAPTPPPAPTPPTPIPDLKALADALEQAAAYLRQQAA